MSGNERFSGHNEKRGRKLDAFIMALFSHRTTEAAAAAAGISPATARRWMRDPSVIERLREARRQAWGHAMAMLQAAAPEGVITLRLLLSAETESVRATAAKALLEMAMRGAEIADIEERLVRLEQLVKHNNWKGPEPDDRHPNNATTGTTRKTNGAA
jgi:hypothetical protein